MTSTGINTNAQFGFTTTLLDLIKKEKPTHIAVAFDTKVATTRHEVFAEYKANRQETPEDILAAVPHIQQILTALNIPILAVDGYEADDVIGHVAKQAEKDGFEVYMVTPDKDYGQLVSEHIRIWRPPAFGNKEEILGPAEVCAKWGIQNVNQVIDILGLMGDAVDNIPGVPSVGEKTAAKLIAEYHSMEGALEAAANGLVKGKLGEKLVEFKEQALLSKHLATIITDIPVEFDLSLTIIEEPNREAVKEVFSFLEFRTLAKRVLGEELNAPANTNSTNNEAVKDTANSAGADLFGNPLPAAKTSAPSLFDAVEETKILQGNSNAANTPHEYQTILEEQDLKNLVQNLLSQTVVCFDTETTSLDANQTSLVGLSFSYEKAKAFYIPCNASLTTSNILNILSPFFLNTSIIKVGHNIKFDMLVLKWHGIEVAGPIYDTMLAHYLVEPEAKRSMDMLSVQYLDYSPISITELIGKKGKSQGNMGDVALAQISEYAAEDADITLQLKTSMDQELLEKEVRDLANEIEFPLVEVLRDMEFEGIRIDEKFLNDYSKELSRLAHEHEEKVFAQAGLRFNLASPKQLGDVLFEHLKLDPKAKKTKTGQYATGEEVLLKLAKEHQIVDDILAFREYTKLNNTYVEKLPLLVNPKSGRIHTSYSQAVAVTGRLSSNDPNLQNIPVRTDRGREIRKAFIARDENHVLMSADYSQIELRIVAAISGDPNMCQAFRDGMDIHTATAAKVFNVSPEEVTKEMRYKAKSVNFGIIYGQGAFGLAENLKISRSEAKEIIDSYKKEFSGIQKYMTEIVQSAVDKGYVQTLKGRKRWLRDIHSANFTVRAFAERNAINSPIQGSAADMIKLAMIKIHHAIKNGGLRSRLLLQVHDELIFDVHQDEVDIMKNLVLENMRTALLLPNDVPVECEVGVGQSWLEAH